MFFLPALPRSWHQPSRLSIGGIDLGAIQRVAEVRKRGAVGGIQSGSENDGPNGMAEGGSAMDRGFAGVAISIFRGNRQGQYLGTEGGTRQTSQGIEREDSAGTQNLCGVNFTSRLRQKYHGYSSSHQANRKTHEQHGCHESKSSIESSSDRFAGLQSVAVGVVRHSLIPGVNNGAE